jgi:hypothetical protein
LLIPLSAGYSDAVEIYRNGNSLMILTVNTDIEVAPDIETGV